MIKIVNLFDDFLNFYFKNKFEDLFHLWEKFYKEKYENLYLKLLEDLKSVELKESASLMLIRELIGDDKVLLGLASKMLQDISLGYDKENYVS